MTADDDLFGNAATAAPPDGDVVLSDALDLLRGLEPGSVGAVVTDPPYGIAYHSNRHQGRNPHAPIAQDWNVQIGALLAACERALADGGAVYLWTRFDVYPLWAKEVPPSLSLKNMIVWDKGNHSSGDLTGNFGFQHEICMFLTKGRHRLRGHRWSNVWSVPKIAHGRLRMPAEKPVSLFERAISSTTDPGDLVVDPFCGSGTLGEAAARLGRRFLLGDIDKVMVRMARERVSLPVGGDAPTSAPRTPACPVFDVEPANPAFWGLHPEDLQRWSARFDEEQETR